jgi:hypothetical protein
VRRTVPPSAEIEGQIDQLLAVGVGENPRESLVDSGAGCGSGASRPSMMTSRRAVLRCPVMRVPTVGCQLSTRSWRGSGRS